jgi:hypothetical protein
VWTPDKNKLVKVCLHSEGEDVETPSAEDRGPAKGRRGSRRVRIGNVPFLHAKPTYEDVIQVEPDDDYGGKLTWDCRGASLEEICARLTEDSGRWAMILDYQPPDGTTSQAAFTALDMAGERVEIAVEGCYGPDSSRPGRAYLAVPGAMTIDAVIMTLLAANLPMKLTLVHPRDDED